MARRSTSETQKIRTVLVGTEGLADDEQALTILCETLDPESVRLRIAHVLVVPSHVPLDASMEVAERRAAGLLERARGIAGRFNISTETVILRGRAAGECLVGEARDAAAGMLCIRFRSHPVPWGHRLVSETVSTILTTAPCPVMIVHLPHRTGAGGS